MTWFDGNPAHLWQYPPTEEGQRYVECMGGVDALCEKAEQFMKKDDARFAATILAHAVAGYPEEPRPKLLLASAYDTLGFGAENATWRNFYLTGAQELRTGQGAGMVAGGKTQLGPQLTVGQCFEVLAVQLDGERAVGSSITIGFDVTDVNESWKLILSNGVLTGRRLQAPVKSSAFNSPDLFMALSRKQLLEVLRGNFGDVDMQEGNLDAMRTLLNLTSVAQGSVRGPAQL